MLGREPDCRLSAAPRAAAPDDWLWQECGFAGLPDAVLRIGASRSWLAVFGRAALEANGLPDSSEEEALGTAREILSQANSGLSTVLGKELGRDVAAQPLADWTPPDPGAVRWEDALRLDVSLPGGREGLLTLLLSPALERVGERKEEPGRAVAPASPGGPSPPPSKTFGLLLEVELPVSVSFGRAQLPLRDVLKLNSGSIVELNRTISEPVEIIVNNCVIARGEVVVVEGNYGVRIQQVISREERLRTLH
jgi:flagellar motor switch protein FliN/FliY